MGLEFKLRFSVTGAGFQGLNRSMWLDMPITTDNSLGHCRSGDSSRHELQYLGDAV